jgi:predicted metal-dependent peptidase
LDRAARNKIISARTNMLVRNGFFGFLALQLKLVEANKENGLKVGNPDDITTMAVDGIHLYYDPEFVHRIDDEECEAVVAHEVEHCCLQHFSRRGTRHPKIWNIAGDFVINADLTKAGFKLPGVPISMDMIGNPKFKGVKGYLLDPIFGNMNTEAIYDKIMEKVTVIEINYGGADPGGCGGVIDAPNTEKRDEASQTWETSVRIAVQVAAANNAGQIPGSLQKLIDYLKKPKVSWRDQTRRFIDQSLSRETSWARLSRRSVAIGALLPGTLPDRLQHLVFFVDISGSISFELCKQMVGEVAGALDENTADMITVVYADTDVHHVDTYYKGDIVTAGHYRGGGTAFSNSFKWMKEHVPDASCAIYLTDLQVSDFGEDPGCPMLWAVYATDHEFDHLAAQAPFGQCIHISNNFG